MKAKYDEKIEELKGELHGVKVEYDKLLTQYEILREGHNKNYETAFNNTNLNRRGLNILQQSFKNSLRIMGVPKTAKKDPKTSKFIPEDTLEVVKEVAQRAGVVVTEKKTLVTPMQRVKKSKHL